MSARGERTREHLIEVAEQLFGQRGVDNVSLREILARAGQRNAGAMRYHFGNRAGLLQAIADRHLPRLAARQEELLVAAEASDGALLAYVTVLIRPFAEYVDLGPSERAWLRICADLQARPTTSLEEMGEGTGAAAVAAGRVVYQRLAEQMPEDLAIERIMAAGQSAIHICADRSRVLDEPTSRRRVLPADRFVDNLLDMVTGALVAPVTG